jgi:hypothetical protein
MFGLKSKQDKLTLADFLIGVGQLKFRGTSILFRLHKPIADLLSNSDDLKIIYNEQVFGNKDSEYELATHTVKVKRGGVVFDIAKLWELEGAATPSVLKENLIFDDTFSKPMFERGESVDFFNQKSQPNEMLNGLRYFEKSIKQSSSSSSINLIESALAKDAFSWGKVDMSTMARCLIIICKHVQELVAVEDRLLRVPAPCYVLGNQNSHKDYLKK